MRTTVKLSPVKNSLGFVSLLLVGWAIVTNALAVPARGTKVNCQSQVMNLESQT